jgi:hypothetical protein
VFFGADFSERGCKISIMISSQCRMTIACLIAMFFICPDVKTEVVSEGWARQELLKNEEKPLPFGEFTLKKRARFSFFGKIISSKIYDDEPQSKISPGDVVISWGRGMGVGGEVFQRDRWYFFSKKPEPDERLFLTTANLHLVGGQALLALRAKPNQWIKAEGWLVDISGPDGFSWKTSLERDDRGDGACEIFLINRFEEIQ